MNWGLFAAVAAALFFNSGCLTVRDGVLFNRCGLWQFFSSKPMVIALNPLQPVVYVERPAPLVARDDRERVIERVIEKERIVEVPKVVEKVVPKVEYRDRVIYRDRYIEVPNGPSITTMTSGYVISPYQSTIITSSGFR